MVLAMIEYWIEIIFMETTCITLTVLTRIICRGVYGFVTVTFAVFLCRGLTSFSYVLAIFGNAGLNALFGRYDIVEFFLPCMYILIIFIEIYYYLNI